MRLEPINDAINAQTAPFWTNEIAAFKPDYRSNELIALFATDYGAVILSCIYNKQTNEEG